MESRIRPRLFSVVPLQLSLHFCSRGKEQVVIHLLLPSRTTASQNTAACAEQSRNLSLFHGSGPAVMPLKHEAIATSRV